MAAGTPQLARVRIWDPLLRLFHWSLVIAFCVAWFERSDPLIHETAGKIVLALLVFRLFWGLVGPVSARFAAFLCGPRETLQYGVSVITGHPRRYLGHNPAGAAMIVALLACLTLLVASGLTMKTTAFWGNEWVEWIHGTAANVTVALIAAHVLGVVVASLQHREWLPLSMVHGWKSASVAVQAHLGEARLTAGRMTFAAFAVGLPLVMFLGGIELAKASLWRLPRAVVAEMDKRGCKSAEIKGPEIEIYPEMMAHFSISLPGKPMARFDVPASDFLQQRPVLDFSALPVGCEPEVKSVAASAPVVAPPATPPLPAPPPVATPPVASQPPLPPALVPPIAAQPAGSAILPAGEKPFVIKNSGDSSPGKRKRKRKGRRH